MPWHVGVSRVCCWMLDRCWIHAGTNLLCVCSDSDPMLYVDCFVRSDSQSASEDASSKVQNTADDALDAGGDVVDVADCSSSDWEADADYAEVVCGT